MRWTESISEVIEYIEEHITQELSVEQIAKEACISSFYFQKGFAMLCGFTVSEYIRNRRLALAGSELVATDQKIIDIALKYGYDSPDAFTKSFVRFHGVTPTAVRKGGVMIKTFAPLKIKVSLEGGNLMDYKIVEKEAFTIIGASKAFKYETAKEEIPPFWTEFFQTELSQYVCGLYGINIDESMDGNEFEYLIASNYNPIMDVPKGLVTKVIPKFSWAVFACKGTMPKSMQDVNKNIYSQWLPNCKDYDIAAGYCIETYSDPKDYPKGTQDENYYSEIWIPVKRK